MNKNQTVNFFYLNRKVAFHDNVEKYSREIIGYAKRLEYYLEHPEEFRQPDMLDHYMMSTIHDIAQTSRVGYDAIEISKAQMECYQSVVDLMNEE